MLWKSIVETVMDELDSNVYVADYETSELIYMNSQAKKCYGLANDDMSFIGKKCYEVMQGKKEVCSFCKRSILNENNFCQWYNFNEHLGKYFYNRDKIIKIDDRLYHIQISNIDDERMEEQIKLEQQLEIERKLVKCARTLASDLPVEDAINSLLKIVATFFNADRAYVFEINYKKNITNNTYEWAAEGITKEIERLQNVPLDVIDNWISTFEEKGGFYISSLDEDVSKDTDTYEYLEVQQIQSLMAVPLMSKGLIVGFIGVDNPRRNYDDFTLLTSVSYFLQNDLEKRKVYGKLRQLSFEDTLTGLYNRNKYNQVVAELMEAVPHSLGIIYMDLNGLKKMNDVYGHAQGDLLLKRTGAFLNELFEGNAYRIGGDEFVVLLTDITKEKLCDMVDSIQKKMKDRELDLSVGDSWRGENVNVMDQLHKAEKLMYIEKMKHHEKLRD